MSGTLAACSEGSKEFGRARDVRYCHKADISSAPTNAFEGKADIAIGWRHICL
jgi:hypothetical protein